MNGLSEWLRSELLAEIALAALLIEGLVLAFLGWRRPRGLPLRALVSLLLPGALLLLALRAEAGGAAAPWVAACLTAALLAHLADLRQRYARQPGAGSSQPRSGGA